MVFSFSTPHHHLSGICCSRKRVWAQRHCFIYTGGPVAVSGNIENLDPSTQRGFHIHQLGDLSGGCLSTGPHFNPFNKKHGAPTDSERHVGDLGNIKSDENGVSRFTFQDSSISLNGQRSIIGRAVVLHAGTDDLGRGDNEESLKTGNAGARAACGIIGLPFCRVSCSDRSCEI
ncbi:copper/zinc binding superoxide dismutase [Pluteus cervinus]|uniref:Copper/zinc binding superoxide dismutase n=1 Tax=Pluteus cervinus TaxID=181527 RepID=A0ACD3BBB6_9AGAR|nr:copper/zinc binding superoxide dismutase [Pluteus cervinus]